MLQMKCNTGRCKVILYKIKILYYTILYKNKNKQKMNGLELQQNFEKDLEETMILAQKMVWQ